MNTTANKDQRNYAMFDADISGAVLNMQLLRRLLRWLAPDRRPLCSTEAPSASWAALSLAAPTKCPLAG